MNSRTRNKISKKEDNDYIKKQLKNYSKNNVHSEIHCKNEPEGCP